MLNINFEGFHQCRDYLSVYIRNIIPSTLLMHRKKQRQKSSLKWQPGRTSNSTGNNLDIRHSKINFGHWIWLGFKLSHFFELLNLASMIDPIETVSGIHINNIRLIPRLNKTDCISSKGFVLTIHFQRELWRGYPQAWPNVTLQEIFEKHVVYCLKRKMRKNKKWKKCIIKTEPPKIFAKTKKQKKTPPFHENFFIEVEIWKSIISIDQALKAMLIQEDTYEIEEG